MVRILHRQQDDKLSKAEQGLSVKVSINPQPRTQKAKSGLRAKPCNLKLPAAIWVGRVIFVGVLCLVATGLGLAAYMLQSSAELSLARSQFEAIVDRAMYSALDLTNRKMLGAVSITSIYSNSFPDPSQWPFVWLPGFQQVVGNMVATSRGRGIGMAPIVRRDQVR